MTPQLLRDLDHQYRLLGDVTFATVPQLYEQAQLDFGGGSSLEVDLAGVRRSDSAGLALLLEWARLGRRQGCDIVFKHVPEQLNSLIAVSGLESVLRLSR